MSCRAGFSVSRVPVQKKMCEPLTWIGRPYFSWKKTGDRFCCQFCSATSIYFLLKNWQPFLSSLSLLFISLVHSDVAHYFRHVAKLQKKLPLLVWGPLFGRTCWTCVNLAVMSCKERVLPTVSCVVHEVARWAWSVSSGDREFVLVHVDGTGYQLWVWRLISVVSSRRRRGRHLLLLLSMMMMMMMMMLLSSDDVDIVRLWLTPDDAAARRHYDVHISFSVTCCVSTVIERTAAIWLRSHDEAWCCHSPLTRRTLVSWRVRYTVCTCVR